MNQNFIWFCFFLNFARSWWWWNNEQQKTDDNEGNNDGISGRESVDYSYNDYYFSPSPLRRLGQTDDYYYYYADEYYPYIEARNERQQTGRNGAINPLAALVAPLAALALIAVASTASVNPMLLSIATISRNRRHTSSSTETIKIQKEVRQVRVLERFLSSLPGRAETADKLMMSYLECSGLVSSENHCLEQMVCQYSRNQDEPRKNLILNDEDRDVISIVLYNLMSNKLVSKSIKSRLRSAAKSGRDRGRDGCHQFICSLEMVL